MTRKEQITSLRSTLEWLSDEVKVVEAEVDPVIEATGINKAFDDGPVFVFQNVIGFPHARLVASLWGRRDRVARLMGAESLKEAKLRVIEAIKQPVPPLEVTEAPCQEVIIPKEEIDPDRLLPMIQHTEMDGGRFFGSGVHLISGRYCEGKSQLSFYRMSFRGRDYASINMIPGGHGDQLAWRFKDKPLYYVPYFGSIWANVPFTCAGFFELAERIAIGFVQDVTTFTGMTAWGGIVLQVKKRRSTDEGLQRNILAASMGIARGLRISSGPWQRG